METQSLFYEDSHLREFDAQVLTCAETEHGFAISLSATAFYPEGGGQACDLGTLGAVQVLDVQEREGEILHYCAAPLEVGTAVHGVIDWQHRFDLMQQHSGEHIVSGLVCGSLGYHNVGFHVGSDRMEIDFDGPITAAQLKDIERRANEAVWQNLPIECFYPTAEELPHVFYRTKRALPWPVRIVKIGDVDSCACCGVHVKTTGEIGLIKIISCVKFHQGVRIELVCGGRAYDYLRRVSEEAKLVSQTLSVPVEAIGEGTKKLADALAAEKYRSAGLLGRLFSQIANSYAGQKDVVHFEDGLEPAQVRSLADKMVAVTAGYCAVFSGSDGNFCYCLASKTVDLRQMNKELTTRLSGRGGGKPDFQQGSIKATREEIQAFFRP